MNDVVVVRNYCCRVIPCKVFIGDRDKLDRDFSK